jgi:hypothetical protein
MNGNGTFEEKGRTPSWARGDLPTWVAVFLIAIIGWGARTAFENMSATLGKAVEKLHDHETRIVVLEKDKPYDQRTHRSGDHPN